MTMNIPPKSTAALAPSTAAGANNYSDLNGLAALKKDPRSPQALHAVARAFPARYKRLEWLDWREGKLPNADVEYPDLGEPAAFACSNRICSYPSFSADELQATVKQMAKLKPSRASLN